MSQRVQELVQQFTTANDSLIQYIEGCTESELDQVTGGEGWSVRVTAHHIAVSHEPVAGLALLIATGQPLPALTGEMFHQMNAQHATEHTGVSKAAVLETLRSGGAKAAAMVSGISDDALASVGHLALINGEISTQGVIEGILIGHIDSHLGSIKATVGR